MGTTTIEWTKSADGSQGKTWNPVRGCSVLSPGCINCYAMNMAHRFSGPGKPFEGLTKIGGRGPIWTGEVRTAPEMLAEPLRVRKPTTWFVNSMSDLFHEDVPDEYIAAVFGVMAATPRHTYQILTKRAERLPKWFEWSDDRAQKFFNLQPIPGRRSLNECRMSDLVGAAEEKVGHQIVPQAHGEIIRIPWPLPNVWLGVSVESQEYANKRIPHLLRTPAAVRFLSCEPLLGPVDLTHVGPMSGGDYLGKALYWHGGEGAGIDWVIAGAESGRGARPMNEDWVRSIRDQCKTAGVAFFYKQNAVKGVKIPLPVLDGQKHTSMPEMR